jgi:sulfotransferase family protein
MNKVIVDFFVIGVARGGTTSLYNYLQQHPDIFLPKVKECNFFSDVESLDKEVYRDPEEGKDYHMKIIQTEKGYKQLFSKAKNGQLKGEVSPSYMWDKESAKRIYDHNKEAKLIVSLRNPVDRAYSHYLMHYHTGYEKAQSFEQALKAPRKTIWGGGNMYLEMGLYYPQLKAYYDLFDKHNILVMVSEVWTRNNGKALNEVYEFLGIEPFSDYDVEEVFNVSKQLKNKGLLDFLRSDKIKRSLKKVLPEKTKEKIKEQLFYKEAEKQQLDNNIYDSLKEYYREDIKNTEALIGINLTQKWDIGQ